MPRSTMPRSIQYHQSIECPHSSFEWMRRIECRSKSLRAFTETVKRNPRYSVMNPLFERPIAERENEGALVRAAAPYPSFRFIFHSCCDRSRGFCLVLCYSPRIMAQDQ